jgi:ATP-binding cassette, subfamily A (ABC1), member 3
MSIVMIGVVSICFDCRNSIFQPRLSYSPKNPVYDRLVHIVAQVAGLSVHALNNAKELETHLVKNLDFAGIEFPDSSANITQLPDHLDYAIRFPSELRVEDETNPLVNNWQTNNLFPIYLGVGPRKPYDADGGYPSGYFSQGFLHLQHAMFAAFFGMKVGSNTSLPQVPDVLLRVRNPPS